ncbi:MAG TPA: efflux RND transporter periplasmic adaptor subunit, partial [Vicinamibacterales bacterium]|nr:efflux RND transporter periplasmic adaptor subunit [Vicinamibacterales bacterium]
MAVPHGSRKRLYIGIIAVLLVVVAAAGFASLKGASSNVDASKVVTVETGTMVKSVVATGKIEPTTKVEIKSRANGIIERLPVDVDTDVKAGDVLAELDKEQLRAVLRSAEANLQAARAALDAAEANLKKDVVIAEGPDVEFARRNFERSQQLFVQKLIPQSQLDDAHSAVDVATNRQRAAQSQLSVDQATVSQAKAQVAQAKAAADQATESLAYATIRAPIRATVLSRDVEIGSPVSSILNLGANATLVMTLGDIQKVFVRGKVDEADIGRVRLNQPARIRVETFKDRVFGGRVTQISPLGVEKDNVTSFEVKVSIENPGQELKANMTANAEIVLEQFADSLLVPEAAVVFDAKRNPFVDLVDPSSKTGRRRVPITVGVGNGTKMQIKDGVKAGDKVV